MKQIIAHLRCWSDWLQPGYWLQSGTFTEEVHTACGQTFNERDRSDAWDISDASLHKVNCPDCLNSEEYRNRILQRELTK